MKSKTYMYAILVFLYIVKASIGELTYLPRNSTSYVGGITSFLCAGTEDEIYWYEFLAKSLLVVGFDGTKEVRDKNEEVAKNYEDFSLMKVNESFWELKINNVSMDFQSQYGCRDDLLDSTYGSAYLNVEVPAMVTLESSEGDIVANQPHTFTCSAEGAKPAVNIFFIVNGIDIDIPDQEQTQNPFDANLFDTAGSAMLNILSGTKEVSCTASGQVAAPPVTTTIPIEVKVPFSPRVYVEYTYMDDSDGNPISILCNYNAYPEAASFEIFQNETLIASTQSTEISLTGTECSTILCNVDNGVSPLGINSTYVCAKPRGGGSVGAVIGIVIGVIIILIIVAVIVVVMVCKKGDDKIESPNGNVEEVENAVYEASGPDLDGKTVEEVKPASGEAQEMMPKAEDEGLMYADLDHSNKPATNIINISEDATEYASVTVTPIP